MGEKSFTSEAVEGGFWEAMASVAQKIGGLIFTVILARYLLPDGFGLYNLAISVTAIFFMFAQGGIDKTLIRYISAANGKKEKERDYFHYIFRIKIVILLISSIMFIIFSYPISIYVLKKEILFIPLLFAMIFSFVISLEQFFTSFFYAIKNVKYRAIKEMIHQFLRIALVFVVFVLIYNNPEVVHAFIVLILASFFTLLFVLYKLKDLIPHVFKKGKKIDGEKKSKIFLFSFYLSFTLISIVLLDSIDTIMLGLLIPGTMAIGIYKAGFVLMASVAGMLLFSNVLLPAFVHVESKNLERAFNKTFRYLMMITIPASFGLAVLGNYFIVLIYGYEYIDARIPLYFLSMLVILSIQVELYMQLFSARERPKDYVPLLVFIIFVNIVLNFFLIKYLMAYSVVWAISGAAISSVFSWGIYSFGLGFLASKNLGIKTDLSLVVKPLIAALVMVSLLVFLKNILGNISLISGLLLISSGFIVYFLTLCLIRGISKEDYFIMKMLKEKFKKL
jgi:O-antigen/teichoic acid export membrane protein